MRTSWVTLANPADVGNFAVGDECDLAHEGQPMVVVAVDRDQGRVGLEALTWRRRLWHGLRRRVRAWWWVFSCTLVDIWEQLSGSLSRK